TNWKRCASESSICRDLSLKAFFTAACTDCTTRLNARSTTTKAIRLSSVVFRLNMVSFRSGKRARSNKTRVEEALFFVACELPSHLRNKRKTYYNQTTF